MSKTLSITLPDGSVREVAAGTTPADIAASIGPGLLKASLAARVNGELRDPDRPFEGDAALALVTARDEADALELARHDYRSEEHTSELQSLMRISYAVFCLKKK